MDSGRAYEKKHELPTGVFGLEKLDAEQIAVLIGALRTAAESPDDVSASKAKEVLDIFEGDLKDMPERVGDDHSIEEPGVGGIETIDGVEYRRHENGGGLVALTAEVDPSVYVGPEARVTENARVRGYAKISDTAEVSGSAEVSDQAQVSGNAKVTDNARISGDALIHEEAHAFGSAYWQRHRVIPGTGLRERKDLRRCPSFRHRERR